MLTLGVDIGSTNSKAVILENGCRIVAKSIVALGTGTKGPHTAYNNVLSLAGIHENEISRLVATGYGRFSFEQAEKQVSEVSCHAKGVRFLVPNARTVIDIGGQDAKALTLNEQGKLTHFVMNEKCAAGTGRFLDVMSRVLDISVEEMGEISSRATSEVSISNTCAVFAESEVISRLSRNESIENIVAGIHRSVAKRVASQVLRVCIVDDVVMSGGVAHNQGVVKAMESELGRNIIVPEDCQLAGALGAAIIAWEELEKMSEKN